MKLEITSLPESDNVQLTGDLDIYNAESARAFLLDQLTAKPELELDLNGIAACDAAGLQVLLSACLSALAANKCLTIHAISPAVERCSERLGLSPESLFKANR